MAAPRLSGRTLAAVRALAGTPFIRVLRAQAMRDYGVGALLSLGARDRLPLEVQPRPIAARPPRAFGDGGLPTPRGSRETLADLRAAYASGATTPRAVLERVLARAEAGRFGNAGYSPFVAIDSERARVAADLSTSRWARQAPLSALEGAPIPIKDELDMTGLPTRGGTSYLDTPAGSDAFLVRALRDAGAIPFAKTHTTEWGMNPIGQNPHYDMPRNAFNGDRGAGGSSTGTAVAVTLGFAPVGVGSDGGGSIRIPSSLEGIYGLKPTFSRVGRSGDLYGEASIFHLGPLGASVADLAEWMATVGALADPADDLADWAKDRGTVSGTWTAAVSRGVRGARIGVLRGEMAEADPAIAAACEVALRALEADGAVLVDVDLPLAKFAGPIGMLTIGPEGMANLVDHIEEFGDRMGDDLQLVMRLLRNMSAEEVLVAGRHRRALRVQAATTLMGVDLLALPTTAAVAPNYPRSERGVAVADPDGTRTLTRFAFLGNLTGLPAGTVPVGMMDGLPFGLQLMGDAWDEASVLAAMAQLERNGAGASPKPPGWEPLIPA